MSPDRNSIIISPPKIVHKTPERKKELKKELFSIKTEELLLKTQPKFKKPLQLSDLQCKNEEIKDDLRVV